MGRVSIQDEMVKFSRVSGKMANVTVKGAFGGKVK